MLIFLIENNKGDFLKRLLARMYRWFDLAAEYAALYKTYVISFGITIALLSSINKCSFEHVLVSASGLTVMEDFGEACTLGKRTFNYTTHLRNIPADGSLVLYSILDCGSQQQFAGTFWHTTRIGTESSCSGTIEIVGNPGVYYIRWSDIKASTGNSICQDSPTGYDMIVSRREPFRIVVDFLLQLIN